MATSKTLTPTNVTIQIPDFTEKPDQRVNSNCIDKEADAINALNTNITSFSQAIDTVTIGGSYFTIDKSIIVRCGKVVIVSLDAIASKPYNANVVIGTVPSGYRPSSETNSILCFRTTSGNVATYSGFATVGTNGDIKQNITASGATGDKITIMFAYIA